MPAGWRHAQCRFPDPLHTLGKRSPRRSGQRHDNGWGPCLQEKVQNAEQAEAWHGGCGEL